MLRLVVVPLTGEGEAAAGVATVGAASVTFTRPLPLTEPLAALTVAAPVAPGAV